MRVLLLAVVSLAPSSALASMWTDPSWPELLRFSELVVRAKVVEGGEHQATVEVEATLLGEAPKGPLRVRGFNNGRWPPEARKKESLNTGERYLFFLLPDQSGDGYRVFTPSAGEFPIEGDQVRVSLERTGWPRGADPLPLADFEAWVKSGLGRRAGKKADRAVCDAQLRRLERAGERTAALRTLLVAGEDTWSEAFAPLSASKDAAERAALALVLGGVRGAKAEPTLERLLGDADRKVQLAAIEGIEAQRGAAAGPPLLAVLEKASARPGEQRGLMNPDRTGAASPLEAIVWALVRLQHQPAVPVLQRMYESAEGESVELLGRALGKLGSAPPASALKKQLTGPDPTQAIFAIWEAKQTGLRPELEALLDRKDLEPRVLETLLHALAELGDASTAARVARSHEARFGGASGDLLAQGVPWMEALARLDPNGQRKVLGSALRARTGWDWELASDPRASAARLDWAKKQCATARTALAGKRGEVRCSAMGGLGATGKDVSVVLEVVSDEGGSPSRELRDRLAAALKLPPAAVGVAFTWQGSDQNYGEGLVPRRVAEKAIEAALGAMARAPHAADRALLRGLLDSGTATWSGTEKQVKEALAKLKP